jgi:hypothetical protein
MSLLEGLLEPFFLTLALHHVWLQTRNLYDYTHQGASGTKVYQTRKNDF